MKLLLLLSLAACVAGFLPQGLRNANRLVCKTRKPSQLSKVLKAAVEEAPPASGDSESYKFESNVSKVMDIIINSLYSNKDVFLRELISNAADACDKKRFSLVSEGQSGDDLRVRVSADRAANTLTIEDTGIGMNKEELINNLGRIAESGTGKFREQLEAKDKDENALIGQFGVGFYSGFLVADKMTVVTKGSSGQQLRWEASADTLDQYSIKDDDSQPIESPSGTRIVLSLKEEADQYLDDVALKTLIERYSEFISFPIELKTMETKPETVPDESKEPEEDGTIPMKTVMNKVESWKQVNNKKPLWLRPSRQCEPEDYQNFYQQTFNAIDDLAGYSHFKVEGNVDFKAMLFLPSEVPYQLERDMFATEARSMRLYVKRVFINDKFEDLIPRWLIFLRGVVDSDDLPLNVGREILQQSRSLRIIKQRLTKKAIDMFADIAANDAEKYTSVFRNFGKYLKIGVIEEDKYREELTPLIRFYTSHESNMTSLPDYVSRMPADQKNIYYVVGETKAQAAKSPMLEKLREKGYEVLYVSETIDEICLQNIEKMSEHPIVDVGKEASQELDEEERREKQKANDDTEDFRTWMKELLGEKITKVEVSSRLVDSPATIVQSEYGISPNMQKYLRAQSTAAENEESQFQNIFNQAILEINPDHPIVTRLEKLYKETPESEECKETVEMLFETAALGAGYILDNSAEYSMRVTKLMTKIAAGL